jgi:hypothetical protein
MRRPSVMLLSGSALVVLLGAGPAVAHSPETRGRVSFEQLCLSTKLEVTSHYYRCLTGVMRKSVVYGGAPSDELIARCDRSFYNAFARAEKSGSSHTPGGSLRVRDTIKEQVLSTFTHVAASEPCAALYMDADHATGVLSTSQSSIDLAGRARRAAR